MSPLYLQNGKILVRDGKLATSASCCCDCLCPNQVIPGLSLNVKDLQDILPGATPTSGVLSGPPIVYYVSVPMTGPVGTAAGFNATMQCYSSETVLDPTGLGDPAFNITVPKDHWLITANVSGYFGIGTVCRATWYKIIKGEKGKNCAPPPGDVTGLTLVDDPNNGNCATKTFTLEIKLDPAP